MDRRRETDNEKELWNKTRDGTRERGTEKDKQGNGGREDMIPRERESRLLRHKTTPHQHIGQIRRSGSHSSLSDSEINYPSSKHPRYAKA